MLSSNANFTCVLVYSNVKARSGAYEALERNAALVILEVAANTAGLVARELQHRDNGTALTYYPITAVQLEKQFGDRL